MLFSAVCVVFSFSLPLSLSLSLSNIYVYKRLCQYIVRAASCCNGYECVYHTGMCLSYMHVYHSCIALVHDMSVNMQVQDAARENGGKIKVDLGDTSVTI